MNRIKKIIISAIMGLLLILGCYTSVKAWDWNACHCEEDETVDQNNYNVGGYIQISYYNLAWDKNLYCVEKNTAFNRCLIHHAYKVGRYKVIGKVDIVGAVATDHRGEKSKANYQTAVLGYILKNPITDYTAGYSQPNPAAANAWDDTETVGNRKKQTMLANSVWNWMNPWVSEMKAENKFSWLSRTFASSDNGSRSQLDIDAERYAENLMRNGQSEGKITDGTNKNAINIKSEIINGKTYTKIGIFRWNFTGRIGRITVENENGNAINGVMYQNDNGSWYSKVEDIKSGHNFYVFVPTDSNATKITKIKVDINVELPKVHIDFWEGSTTNSWQNLINVTRGTKTEKILNELTYNIPMLGNLQIIKVDADNPSIKLPNVKFVVQQLSTGKYLKQASNGTISYVDRNQATDFFTNQNGVIYISNVLLGSYGIYEIENPNYGYTVSSASETINLTTAGGTITKRITNLKQTGNIGIVKVNQDDQRVTLSGVQFLLTYESGPFAYRTITETDQNGNKTTRTVPYMIGKTLGPYTTDANGRLNVTNLLAGTYRIRETSNPHYGYVFTDEGTTITVGRGTTNKTLRNKQKYVKLSGYVWVDQFYMVRKRNRKK